MENKELELREFIIEEDGDIIGDLSLISFVSDPAIGQKFQLFSTGKYIFAQTNKEKMIVTGPAMRPNVKILRQDIDGTYFNAIFTEEQVRKCSEIYLKNSNHTRTNLEHGDLASQNQIEGVYVVESWIVEDPAKDKSTAIGFKEVQKGDWYVSYKVDNKQFWNFIKEYGGGFSIEGMFMDRIISKFRKQSKEEKIKEIVFDETKTDKEKEQEIKTILFKK